MNQSRLLRTLYLLVFSLLGVSALWGHPSDSTQLRLAMEAATEPELHFDATMELCSLLTGLVIEGHAEFPQYLQENAQQAIQWAKENGTDFHHARSLEYYFNLEYHRGANIHLTIKCAQALLPFEEQLPTNDRFIFFHRLSELYQKTEKYELQLGITQKMFELRKSLGDEQAFSEYYGTLGVIYYRLLDLPNSLKNYRLAAREYEKEGNFVRHASLQNNIGILFEDHHLLDSARVAYIRAIDILDGDSSTTFFDRDYQRYFRDVLLMNLNGVDQEFLSEDEKVALFGRLLNGALKSDNIFDVHRAYFVFAKHYFYAQKYPLAQSYLDSAFTTAIRAGSAWDQIQVLKYQAKLALITGHTNEGLTLFSRVGFMEDSVEKSNRASDAVAAAAEFETRERELELAQSQQALLEEQNQSQKERFNRQIITFFLIGVVLVLLILFYFFNTGRKKSVALNTQKQELEVALTEKEILLKEIHHRVKNNMQVVSGLLELQAHEADDPEVSRVVNEGKSRIETMAIIHQMLYTSSNLATVHFSDYVHKLSVQIMSAFHGRGEVEVKLDVPEIPFDLDTCMTLGLITHELLNNSMKYAFPSGNGKVSIALREVQPGHFEYTVSDNGVGMSATIDPKACDSLGLKLVHMLSSELRASVEFKNTPGVTCTMRWKGYA